MTFFAYFLSPYYRLEIKINLHLEFDLTISTLYEFVLYQVDNTLKTNVSPCDVSNKVEILTNELFGLLDIYL